MTHPHGEYEALSTEEIRSALGASEVIPVSALPAERPEIATALSQASHLLPQIGETN